jgi:hypothetical protein
MSELLTLDDIAKLWKVRREFARRYIVRRPGFPDPAPGSTRKNLRWREPDIHAFLLGSHENAHQS